MTKRDKLLSALATAPASTDGAIVRRLLTPIEWDAVAGGCPYGESPRYEQNGRHCQSPA